MYSFLYQIFLLLSDNSNYGFPSFPSTLEGLSDTICALDSRGAQVLHQFATTLSESQDLQDDDTSSTDGISKNKRKSSREKVKTWLELA